MKLMARSGAQTTFRLPDEMLKKLHAAAVAHGGGIGQEIVSRLERTFVADDETNDLLFEIAWASNLLGEWWTPWHKDADAWQVFRDAIVTLLDKLKPEASGTPKPRDAQVMLDGPAAGERLAMSVFWR
jgi:hypothetical protein